LRGVVWEVFAVAFSRCVGCGWEKGAFFFAWVLPSRGLGFYLKKSRERPPVSRLFFGVNVLMVSVLS